MLPASRRPQYLGNMSREVHWRDRAFENRFPCVLLVAVMACLELFVSGCASISALNPAPAALSVVPASVDFKTVVIGQKNSQTLTVTNTSEKPVDLKSVHVSGTGFALASGKVPVVLRPGASSTLSVAFSPTSAATVDGA